MKAPCQASWVDELNFVGNQVAKRICKICAKSLKVSSVRMSINQA